MSNLRRAQDRLRDRFNLQRERHAQMVWLAGFNRMVRVANWRLNVERRWP